MSGRADEQLLTYIASGLRMMVAGCERALDGDRRSWIYEDQYLRRRRPKGDIPPAAPPEVVNPLIARLDAAAREQPTAYETLLTSQEIADFLGLERISVNQLAAFRHVDSMKIGGKLLIKLGELRRYLEEGPSPAMTSRADWRPLLEEFPGRRKAAELAARTEVLRQKYDAVTIKDLRELLDLDWGVSDRLERKGIIQTFDVPEPNAWRMVKKADIPKIEAWLEEEEARKQRRRAERAAQKKEPRIKL